MFCNNCGAQVPDGTNFCNNCGSPVAASAAPQAQFAPMPPAAPQPEPKKKSNTPVIIAVIAVVLAIAVFCVTAFVAPGFLLKDKEDGKEKDSKDLTSISEEATKNNNKKEDVTPEPVVSLDEAEDVATCYFDDMSNADYVALFEAEIIGYDVLCDYVDDYFKEATGISDSDELYATLSEGLGVTINDAEDYLEYMFDYIGEETDTYSCEVKDSAAYTEADAADLVEEARDDIDLYIDSDVVDWDEIENYAMVELTVTSDIEEDVEVLLGYIDGEWKIIHLTSDGEYISLMSVYFLSGMQTD